MLTTRNYVRWQSPLLIPGQQADFSRNPFSRLHSMKTTFRLSLFDLLIFFGQKEHRTLSLYCCMLVHAHERFLWITVLSRCTIHKNFPGGFQNFWEVADAVWSVPTVVSNTQVHQQSGMFQTRCMALACIWILSNKARKSIKYFGFYLKNIKWIFKD